MNDMADALKRALSFIRETSGRPKKRQLMNHRHHNIRWPPISHTPQETSMAEAIKITVTLINQRGNKTIIKYKIECNNNKKRRKPSLGRMSGINSILKGKTEEVKHQPIKNGNNITSKTLIPGES